MDELIRIISQSIHMLRRDVDARVILISAYQPDIVPWEDDLHWLEKIKQNFPADPQVLLMDAPIALSSYFYLMSRLKLMIGMRLHSSLIALRFGVPAINISYTLKGRAILDHMGLSQNVFDLHDYLLAPERMHQRIMELLHDWDGAVIKTQQSVIQSIAENMNALSFVLAIPNT
jgi:polysaccharide pyruvyl transferase WcaK-like protein